MQLFDLTTTVNEDGSRIVSVAGRISDYSDSGLQTEWISFDIEVDLPTVRNGALLRAEVLKRVRDIADQLATDFERLGAAR